MGYNPDEIEEILNSIKNKEERNENKIQPITLPPPKPKETFNLTVEDVIAFNEERTERPKEPEKPAPAEKEEPPKWEKTKREKPVKKEKPKPVKEEKPKREKPVKQEKPKKEKPVKAEKPKAEKPPEVKKEKPVKEKKPEPVKKEKPKREKPVKQEKPKKEKPVKTEKPKAEKPEKKLKFNSKYVVATVAIVLAVAVAIGAYLKSQNLYINKYAEKYNVSFPRQIPEELCDYYGRNQTLAGSIVIEDNGSETPIYSSPAEGDALFEKGSDINEDQHYRAAALSVSDVDLEALYKTPEGYLSSSQSFTFKTIYGELLHYHIIAAYIVNTRPEDDNGYAFPYNCYGNFTEKSYKFYMDTIRRRSLYDTGYKIAQEDYCMTLTVPSDIMPDFRFAVVGVLVDEVVKTESVKENKMLRYPQAYCDKLGIDNIFSFAYKWYPEVIINPDTGRVKQLTAEDFK